MENSNSLLTPDELAAVMRVSVKTVRRWVREKRVPCIHVSRRVIRFRLDRVLDSLEVDRDDAWS